MSKRRHLPKERKHKDSNILNVSVDNYTDCGFCKKEENAVELNVPWEIWSQWLYISNKMGNKEWGAVFWVKDGAVVSYKIPNQTVSSVECEFEEELGGDGIVHSHHNMNAFHSSQDDAHARNLYKYSIVLSNKDTYEATIKIKLPCGAFGYADVKIFLINCPEFELEKIKKKTFRSKRYKGSGYPYDYRKDRYLRDDTFDDRIDQEEEKEEKEREATVIPCHACTEEDCRTCEYFIENYATL